MKTFIKVFLLFFIVLNCTFIYVDLLDGDVIKWTSNLILTGIVSVINALILSKLKL